MFWTLCLTVRIKCDFYFYKHNKIHLRKTPSFFAAFIAVEMKCSLAHWCELQRHFRPLLHIKSFRFFQINDPRCLNIPILEPACCRCYFSQAKARW